jgi:hypothetical protein
LGSPGARPYRAKDHTTFKNKKREVRNKKYPRDGEKSTFEPGEDYSKGERRRLIGK